MNRTTRIVASLGLLLVALALPAAEAEKKLSLTVRGGFGFIGSGGDMKSFFDATLDRWTSNGFLGKLGHDYVGRALDFSLAADWRFSERIGLRLAAGYLFSRWRNELEYTYDMGSGTVQGTMTYQLSALPITLAPFLHIPLGHGRIQLGAGPTLYLVRFRYDNDQTFSEPTRRPDKQNWTWEITETFRSSLQTAIGGQAFASLTLPIVGGISLTLEGGYRLARFIDLRGTFTFDSLQTWTGGSSSFNGHIEDAYVWNSTSVKEGHTWHYMDFYQTAPTDNDVTRHFKFDLGELFTSIGLQIDL